MNKESDDNDFDLICGNLWKQIESDENLHKQAIHIFDNDDGSMLDSTFLGFVDVYYHLSKIIPKGRVIYDMGCCNAFQSWFFKDHKKYIGVDASTELFFDVGNSEFYNCTIKEFLDNNKIENPHFAICNYVPPWYGSDNCKLVRNNFRYVFVYYPEDGDDPDLDREFNELLGW